MNTVPSGPEGDGIDIVMPLYDKERYVGRAVESVLGQTHRQWRLTIVDDGSTDGGPDVVAGYLNDPRITMLSQSNAGPGAARNAGVRHGAAPLVAFLDADDEWLPDHLAEAAAILRRHPRCAASVTAAVWGPGAQDRRERYAAEGIGTGPWRCPESVLPAALKDAVDFFRPSTTVVRRSVLAELGGFYDRNRCTYAEDSYLWVQLLMRHPVHRDLEPRVWMHDEASDLGPRRRAPFPVPPALRHVDDLVAQTPPSHRDALARFFDWYAVWVAARLANQGEGPQAIRLLRTLDPAPTDPQMAADLRRARRRSRMWPVRRLRWRWLQAGAA